MDKTSLNPLPVPYVRKFRSVHMGVSKLYLILSCPVFLLCLNSPGNGEGRVRRKKIRFPV
jgi:hypothetical protein